MTDDDKVIMTDDVKHSLAWDLLVMINKQNTLLKVLLGISIIANVIIVLVK